jgi:hypothetical protein
MKKNNFLTYISNIIIILSILYLALKIYTLSFYIKSWLRSEELSGLLFGIFRDINEMLYVPLWGIMLSFALIFCEYWIRDRKKLHGSSSDSSF